MPYPDPKTAGPSPSSTMGNGALAAHRWAVEVAKGVAVGARYDLRPPAVLLGNDLSASEGLDLSAHEPPGPRRMDARQAAIHLDGPAPRVVDLDSRAGTLVNRRRILPGQEVALKPGDLIDMGAVRLRLVALAETATPPPAAPRPVPTGAPAAFSHRLPGGTTCRGWDDFLTASAQDWKAMREELESGRITAFLRSIGRDDLLPTAVPGMTADERLDDWLGRLPTVRPGQPELEVYPEALQMTYTSHGGRTRKTVRVANVGYRLLVCRARVEPAGTDWIHLPVRVRGQSFSIVEGLDIPVEIDLPEQAAERRSADLVFEGNGGTARVPVIIEPGAPAAKDRIPDGEDREGIVTPGWAGGRLMALGGMPVAILAPMGAAVFAAGRVLAGLSSALIGIEASGPATLPGPALALGLAGVLAGGLAAMRAERAGDLLPAGFAGGVVGACIAAVAVAMSQAVEPWLGMRLSATAWAPVVLWATLGAGLCVAAGWLLPGPTEEKSR